MYAVPGLVDALALLARQGARSVEITNRVKLELSIDCRLQDVPTSTQREEFP